MDVENQAEADKGVAWVIQLKILLLYQLILQN